MVHTTQGTAKKQRRNSEETAKKQRRNSKETAKKQRRNSKETAKKQRSMSAPAITYVQGGGSEFVGAGMSYVISKIMKKKM
jgi:hypothetical protein